VVYNRSQALTYTGYDWNSPTASGNTNCDGCGGSFNTGLSHRSMLYWENQDTIGSYTTNQRFHAQPLSLVDSTGPDNDVQDIAFYLREAY
jgi:hypothetical protein